MDVVKTLNTYDVNYNTTNSTKAKLATNTVNTNSTL